MAVTDEELAEKQERNLKLRQQLADEETKRLERERGMTNDITAAQLDAEAVQLETQIAAAKQANKVGEVKAGAAAPLEAARAQMEAAVAAQKAQEDSVSLQEQQKAAVEEAEKNEEN